MADATIHGIYPMLYSFYAADGGLDRGAHRAQTEACIAAGVHGLATGGLASDCRRLTVAEKHQTVAWLAEDCAGCLPRTLSEPRRRRKSPWPRSPPPMARNGWPCNCRR